MKNLSEKKLKTYAHVPTKMDSNTLKTFTFHIKHPQLENHPKPLHVSKHQFSKSTENMLSLFGIESSTETEEDTPNGKDTLIHISTSLFDIEHIDCVDFILHETGVDEGEIDQVKKEIINGRHPIP